MSGDYLHVGRDLRNYLLDAVDHAIYAAAAPDVDERESVGYEVVAHVHHVGLGEKDDRIAVGVASGKVESANVFAIEMHGHIMIEGEDGQRIFRLRLGFELHRSAIARRTALLEPLADIIVRNDGSLFLEVCIPAGVISVIMGIDDESNRLVSDPFQCSLDFLGEWRVLIVHNDNAVLAYRGADVPRVRALQHVDAASDLGDFDLNLGEILLLGPDRDTAKQQAH